jgi:hypothetical protein
MTAKLPNALKLNEKVMLRYFVDPRFLIWSKHQARSVNGCAPATKHAEHSCCLATHGDRIKFLCRERPLAIVRCHSLQLLNNNFVRNFVNSISFEEKPHSVPCVCCH